MDDRFAGRKTQTVVDAASTATANTTTPRPKTKPIGVDLFCGAGGMSLGFEQAGFDVRVAVDIEQINVDTHNLNFPNCKAFVADVSKLTAAKIRSEGRIGNATVDVVFGGPPCQSFSLIGKRDPNDPRRALIFEVVRIAKELDASYFVIENVAGLLSGSTKTVIDEIEREASAVGYAIVREVQVLNAAQFGVPQNRRRVFILGHKVGVQIPNYPKPLDSHPPSVWDAISDLAQIRGKAYFEIDKYHGRLAKPSEYANLLRSGSTPPFSIGGCLRTRHSNTTIRRFAKTAPGTQEAVSRFYRLSREGLSCTLRAGTGKDKGSYMAARPIHPTQPRCITVREAARLHSYPDWFSFHPTRWHGFKQVGNSVPPLLANAVASSLYLSVVSNVKEPKD